MPRKKKVVELQEFTILFSGKPRIGSNTSHEALVIALTEGAVAICAMQGRLLKTYTDTEDWKEYREYYGLISE
jgi:hypothetical protein